MRLDVKRRPPQPLGQGLHVPGHSLTQVVERHQIHEEAVEGYSLFLFMFFNYKKSMEQQL